MITKFFSPTTLTQGSQVPLSGNYVLTARHSGQTMTVSGNSTSAGAPIVQTPWAAAADEQWALAPASSAGYYTVGSRSSGLLFDITGGSHANGAVLEQWAAHGGPNQQFSFVPYGDGRGYFNIGNLNTSGMCVDVLGVSQAVGASIAQWTCNGGANQQWYMTPASPAVP